MVSKEILEQLKEAMLDAVRYAQLFDVVEYPDRYELSLRVTYWKEKK